MGYFYNQQVLFKSLFWGVFAGILSQGLNFLTNILIARLLGGIFFGELTLYVSANASLQTFGIFGLNVISTVLVSRNINNPIKLGKIIPVIYSIVIFSVLLISILLLLNIIYPIIDFKIWKTDSILVALGGIIWFISSAIDVVQSAILIGFKAFKDLAKVSLLKGVMSLFIVAFLVNKFGIVGGIWGYALSFSISLLCNLYFIDKNLIRGGIVSLDYHISKYDIMYVIKLSFPIFIAALFVTPAQWIANMMIFDRQNGGVALGIFAIANQWLVLIQFFPLQISKVALPFLISQIGTSNYRNTEKLGLCICMLISLLIVVVSFLFGHFIIESLYHFNYELSKNAFCLMLLAGLFSTLNLYLGQTIIASGKIWGRMVADIFIALSLIITVLWMSNSYIILALPLGYLVSFIIGSVVLLFIKNRYENR